MFLLATASGVNQAIVQNKLDLLSAMMDCLYAKCILIITDCVMAELEKLGQKYRVALQIARDERWERLKCSHKGTYADDCLGRGPYPLHRRLTDSPGIQLRTSQSTRSTLSQRTIGI